MEPLALTDPPEVQDSKVPRVLEVRQELLELWDLLELLELQEV